MVVNIGSMQQHLKDRIRSFPDEVKQNIEPDEFLKDMFSQPRDHLKYRNSCDRYLPYGYLDVTYELLLDDMDFMLCELDELLRLQVSYICPELSDQTDQLKLISIIEPGYGRFIYDA